MKTRAMSQPSRCPCVGRGPQKAATPQSENHHLRCACVPKEYCSCFAFDPICLPQPLNHRAQVAVSGMRAAQAVDLSGVVLHIPVARQAVRQGTSMLQASMPTFMEPLQTKNAVLAW